MKAIAIRAASVLVTLGLAVASGACAGDATQGASGEDVAQTGGQRVSFEAWAKANVRQEGEVYYVDGDFGLTREQAIDSTKAVALLVAVMAVYVAGVDYVLSILVRAILGR